MPRRGEMTATTLPSNESKAPPRVTTKSASIGSVCTPNNLSMFVETSASASFSFKPPSIATCPPRIDRHEQVFEGRLKVTLAHPASQRRLRNAHAAIPSVKSSIPCGAIPTVTLCERSKSTRLVLVRGGPARLVEIGYQNH